jgi:ParB family chromosome partitioning protein
VLQPIIVIRDGNNYKIVAGERRWRAAKQAKLEKIPAIVRSLQELERIEMALIENVQRVDLSPLEQAVAIYKLQQQFSLELDQIAKKLGKAPSTVSNVSRLLQLPDSAKKALAQGKLSEGHARAILALRSDSSKQQELLDNILKNKWTVRQAEAFVINQRSKNNIQSDAGPVIDKLSQKLGLKVAHKTRAKGGELIIRYKDSKELDLIAKRLL